MFLCRLRSFQELEQYRGRVAWRHWLDSAEERRMPCADEIAYAWKRLELPTLRSQCAYRPSNKKSTRTTSMTSRPSS
jgi:hypothetical protein